MSHGDDHLRRARRMLDEGRHLLAGGYTDGAGRQAYLASFNAARAFIVERTGKSPKAHGGVRGEFARLAQAEPMLGRELTTFLANGFELKVIADYDGDGQIEHDDAVAALAMADRFVGVIETLLPPQSA